MSLCAVCQVLPQFTHWDVFSHVSPDWHMSLCVISQVLPQFTHWDVFSCVSPDSVIGTCHAVCQGGTHWVMHHLFIDCHLIRWLTPVTCCLSGVTRGHRVGCVQSGLPRGRTHQNCECIQYYCCVISITRIWSFIFVTREVNVGFVFSIIALHQLWDVLTDEWGFNSGCIHLKSSQRLYLRK